MKRLLVLAAVFSSSVALAASADKPHPHKGIVDAYEGAPPTVDLSDTDLATLATGEAVRKQVQYGGSGGRGVAVMDINAPPKFVWAKIGDYSSYPDWIENLNECEIYAKDGRNVYVRFDASMRQVSGMPCRSSGRAKS